MASHASIPVIDRIRDGVLRIYIGTRDQKGRSLPALIEVDADNPQRILRICDTPVLFLGKLGTFDDNGIMPSWIVHHCDKSYLYYIGWNPGVTVPYRLAIGLAVSTDGGETYHKYSEGPILDRDIQEPYFCTTPCVMVDGATWKMWYTSCTRWELVNERLEPFYHVRYAESTDGIHWCRTNHICIDYDDFADAIARPYVFRERELYKMIYSYRSAKDYRTERSMSYRLGYAESVDGVNWERKDAEVGIDRSDTGWDSEMIAYSFLHEHKGKKYLFYAGNGFGKSGFGYAILE